MSLPPRRTVKDIHIASVTREGNDHYQADARLIAAAPDLLAAATDLLATIDASAGYLPPILRRDAETLRAAIARAGGKE